MEGYYKNMELKDKRRRGDENLKKRKNSRILKEHGVKKEKEIR